MEKAAKIIAWLAVILVGVLIGALLVLGIVEVLRAIAHA
jgi:hypothetical protein